VNAFEFVVSHPSSKKRSKDGHPGLCWIGIPGQRRTWGTQIGRLRKDRVLFCSQNPCFLLLCFGVANVVDFGQCDDVTTRLRGSRGGGLVLEVVGVLPDVVAQDGVKTLGERRILIGVERTLSCRR